MHPYEFNADNAAVLNQNALGCREELKSNAFGPGQREFLQDRPAQMLQFDDTQP